MALSQITVQNILDELSSFDAFNGLSTNAKYAIINTACQQIANLYNAKSNKTDFYKDTTAVASLISGIPLPDMDGNSGKALKVNATEDGVEWGSAGAALLGLHISANPVASGNTRYSTFFWNTVESSLSQAKYFVPPGNWTIKSLMFGVVGVGGGGATCTIQKNGSNTTIVASGSMTTAWASYSDTTHTATLTTGDYLSIKLSATSNTIAACSVALILEPA